MHLIAVESAFAKWQVLSVTGERIDTDRLIIFEDGTLTMDDNKSLAPSEWCEIQQLGPKKRTDPKPLLILNNRDVLRGDIISADDSRLVFELSTSAATKPQLNVPLSQVAAYFKSTPSDRQWCDELPKPRPQDILMKQDGEILAGTLTKIDPEQFTLVVSGKSIVVSRVTATALFFNTELARNRIPKDRHYKVTLLNGALFTVLQLSTNMSDCVLTLGNQQQLRLPWAEISRIDVVKTAVVDLVSLKPTKVAYQSFDGESRVLIDHFNSVKTPLRLQTTHGLEQFPFGLGGHLGMTITYDLAGKFQRFTAMIGLDAVASPRGQGLVKMLLDGQPTTLPNNGRLDVNAVPVNIDLKRCQQLTIIFERVQKTGVHESVNVVQGRLHQANLK